VRWSVKEHNIVWVLLNTNSMASQVYLLLQCLWWRAALPVMPSSEGLACSALVLQWSFCYGVRIVRRHVRFTLGVCTMHLLNLLQNRGHNWRMGWSWL
jgi:hypothetical protein